MISIKKGDAPSLKKGLYFVAILNMRIKQRREALELSQSELAELLGYSDRSTIAKIEKGTNDITQSKIESFAEALHTTPAYLMGWTDDWYDYEKDEDSRFSEIPTAQFEALKETYNNDLPAVWRAWRQIQKDALHEAYGNPAAITAKNIQRELPYATYREVLSEGGMRLLMDADVKLPEEHVEEIVEFIKMKQRKYGR